MVTIMFSGSKRIAKDLENSLRKHRTITVDAPQCYSTEYNGKVTVEFSFPENYFDVSVFEESKYYGSHVIVDVDGDNPIVYEKYPKQHTGFIQSKRVVRQGTLPVRQIGDDEQDDEQDDSLQDYEELEQWENRCYARSDNESFATIRCCDSD